MFSIDKVFKIIQQKVLNLPTMILKKDALKD